MLGQCRSGCVSCACAEIWGGGGEAGVLSFLGGALLCAGFFRFGGRVGECAFVHLRGESG